MTDPSHLNALSSPTRLVQTRRVGTLPRLLLLTDRSQLPLGRSLRATVGAAVGAGLTHVVLRELDLTDGERAGIAADLLDIGATVIAARRPVEGCVGVHLAARQPAPEGVPFGRSCHDAAEVRAAAAEGAAYATLGPYAASASKPGYGPPVRPDAYADLPIPTYALGGVTPANARRSLAAGATGVAVMGAVMRAGDPASVVTDLLAVLPVTPPVVLAVAGTDSGGAAGLAADLATLAALGAHGACVVTAVTAQDTTGVRDVHPIPQPSIDAQLDAVFDDLPVAAVKTGMLGAAEAVVCLSTRMSGSSGTRPHLVVDPVLVATSGAVLGDAEVRDAYLQHLLPVATVATPNADEAVALLGEHGEPADLAAGLTEHCPAVVLTGGGADRLCTDWLAIRGAAPVPLTHPAVPTDNDHGTGCTYSTALAAHLAAGHDLRSAAEQAAAYTTHQLVRSTTWSLGRGRGPIAHTQGEDK